VQQEASAGEPPEMSPIGQLSTTGDNTGTPARNEILKQIDDTEKGLSAIKRPLKQEEQTTATEIRTFLTKAKQALSQDDLTGANTLVTKAKVLLDELTKS
jgi:ribosomal protein S20